MRALGIRSILHGDIRSTSLAISNTYKQHQQEKQINTVNHHIALFLIKNKSFIRELLFKEECLLLYLEHKRDPQKDHHETIKHAPAVFNVGVISLETEMGW